jgi:hypothetical protein
MGKVNALTHLFNAGEVSRAALNRVDKEIIRLHAERQENIVPYSIGKATMRPGFQFLDESLDNNRPRLLPFVKGIDDTALIEMTNGAMRVRVDDEVITRAAVDATITNGDFDSATGWTTTATTGASATIAGGTLTLEASARGSEATCSQEVETGSPGEVHALRIEVTRGPVTFRCGASSGSDEYIAETALGTGTHSLAFQHTGITSIDDNTVLLMHFDGSDVQTSAVDSSDFGHSCVFSGNAQLDTGQSKFGGASLQLDGSSGYVTLDGGSDFAFGEIDFTIDFWVRIDSSPGSHVMLESYPTGVSSGAYYAIFIDTSNRIRYTGNGINLASSAVSAAQWYHVAAVRNSGTTTLYLNGVAQGSDSDGNDYLSSANRPLIGSSGTSPGSNILDGWIDELRISKGIARWTSNFSPPSAAYSLDSNPDGSSFFVRFSSKLEREIVVDSIQVESEGAMEIAAPWGTDDLRLIRHAQEGDIIFLANGNWQQRTIERRAQDSWSLVKYDPEDGPFTVSRTAAVRLSTSDTHGNVTLDSDAAFFRADHVGALMRLNHDRTERNWDLAGDETYTDPFRVRGIGSENNWTYAITGTWSGTIVEQRSYDGEDTGFKSTTTTHTINASGTATTGDEYDNQIFWMRYGFKDSDHTSGLANIAVGYSGSGGFGIARVTEFVSDTQVEAEILSDFRSEYATDSWLEGDWSDRRGWPEAVGFFDGRLWWGRRGKFWGSESDDYYAFNLETEGDAGSIQRSIATSGHANEIHWILGLQRLIFGTNGAPISARSSSFDEPLTPTNITRKPTSTDGAAQLSPVAIGSRGIFVSSDLERLHEIAYSVDAQDYVTTDLTRINEDFADSENPDLFADAFVELAYQNSPVPYLWALKDDGVAAMLLFNPSEEARAGFKIATGRMGGLDDNRPCDRIVSVAILPQSGEDLVYIAVERTIDDGAGGTERNYYIEKAALHRETITRVYNSSTKTITVKNGLKMADSFITATGLGGIGQVFTGLDHLEGREVILIGETDDGGYGPTGTTYTVADGQIATEEGVTGTVCIGLPYEGYYKSAKLAFAGQAGSALLQKKRVEHIGLALLDTHPEAILIGQSFDESEMDALPGMGSDGLARGAITVFERTQEEEPFPFNGHWDTDARVHLKIRPGYSATLSAMLIGVETKEK